MIRLLNLVWVLLFGLVSSAQAENVIYFPDINGDDIQNISDVQCTLLALFAETESGPDPDCVAVTADVNGDGEISVVDVVIVIKALLGADIDDTAPQEDLLATFSLLTTEVTAGSGSVPLISFAIQATEEDQLNVVGLTLIGGVEGVTFEATQGCDHLMLEISGGFPADLGNSTGEYSNIQVTSIEIQVGEDETIQVYVPATPAGGDFIVYTNQP